MSEKQKAGFVSIIGKPNAGKSTLLNALIGMKFAIATSKVQTTRHRIMGIVIHKEAQLIFSDTPGIIQPHYKLQERMMDQVRESLEDADILILLLDVTDPEMTDEVRSALERSPAEHKLLVVNKVDRSDQEQVFALIDKVKEQYKFDGVLAISALEKFNTNQLLDLLAELCPEHPYYYPEDQLTDKPERFFMSEMIREKILLHYRKEIPYSVEVVVEEFKEEPQLVRISATIFTERKSQKGILIGEGGSGLKRVGTEARKDMEEFLGKKVFLQLFVKVREQWRNNESLLRKFGYGDPN
ncbi:MAG: GTPase Era [Flavobacteriales bacterium]|nr:GTPase Era [Flavobacteriales bacterium]